ncbi:unnamed protein product [Ambrosiozyma monospora]|uniref:Unnamed protein product n=1 Tax=Ambrosiozyma monospora TaxID=43982 RepID=A0A9W6YNB9_AMBMO|nr:unnamed protein product [Ambrosiozyma monospora]
MEAGLSHNKNTPKTKGTVARTRKRREIAPYACQTCNRKKVKCDLVTKNYPHEKCTTCAEFGVECILKKRRKKRTRDQIEADRLREQRGESEDQCQVQFKFEQPIESLRVENEKQKSKKSRKRKVHKPMITSTASTTNTCQFVSITASSSSSSSSSISPAKTLSTPPNAETSQSNTSTASSSSSSFSSPLFINKTLFMSRKIDCNKTSVFFRELHNYNSLPCLSMRTLFTPADLINRQSLTSLEVNGCFQLPSLNDCKLYIDAYFEKHEPMFPILSRKHFDEHFSDLTNPTSLLLIRAILYIGCRFSKFKELQKGMGDDQNGQTAKQRTQSVKIKKEIALLYNRAKMISDVNFEWNPLYYIISQFLLTNSPDLTQSCADFSESVTRVIYMADRLGLNVSHSNGYTSNTPSNKTDFLTTEERNMHKRLFWLLITRDRTIALVTSRSSYDSAIKYRSVPLQIEDFSDMAPQEQRWVAESYVDQVVAFHQLLKDVTKIEICANDAFDDHKPFIHFHRKIDSLVNEVKQTLDKKYTIGRAQSINSFMTYCIFFMTKMFIERLHLLRVINLVIRCTYECTANKKNGKSIDNYEPPEPQEDIGYVHHWDTLFDSTHQLANLFTEHIDE